MTALLPFSALDHLAWLEVPLWVFDLEHCRVPWANPAGVAFWQAPSSVELSARDFSDMSESTAMRLHLVTQAHQEGRTTHEQWTLYPKGQPVTVDLQSRGIALDDGRPAILFAAVHVHTDVDPVVLRGVEAMKHMAVKVALHRLPDGEVLMRNPAALQSFGPLSGSSPHDELRALFADPGVADEVLRHVRSGQAYAGEAELQTRQGRRWHGFDVRPVWDPVSGERAVQVNARDISDLKDVQRALEQARNAAEAANRAKSSFLANMSHEIRTPMNGVLGMTELVLNTPLTGRQREFLELAHSSARSLLAIINDVLDFSKIEADKLVLERTPFRVRALVDEVLHFFQAQARQKNLSLCAEFGADVPTAAVGDPGRIRQVLTNLLSNGLKFTTVGEVRVATGARPLPDGDVMLEFVISDTGIGMTPQEQATVFEPFMQADNSLTRRHGGTGLGLAIVRRLVDLMGGEVSVHSAPGYGTTFRCTVRCQVVAASEGTPGSPAARPRIWPRLQGRRVLLAEDNPINQTLAVAMLGTLGMHCEVVAHGADAVERLRAERFDAVLMDVQMPIMGGFEATGEIRRHERESALPRTPIVAMTAYAMEGDRERCLAAGMDGYVAKPVQVETLAQALAGVLGEER
ncbi:ATP-binding protein [Schlegelella sp. S2-27]|uniref:histidine kinase n=1 Tax=Caldimonas mangrovi TaxID=2944811 RepID=A0ABT0YHX4_9BURK|nr:ATP-binding protein [Caldimonas mangrovi]MCM5677989.1 ATP-binding protein [Caldimonas mangrovi]